MSDSGKIAFPSLRNDIQFGDSRADVRSKETMSMLMGLDASWDHFGRDYLEGIANSEADYHFTDDDRLEQVLYHLDFNPTSTTAQSAWSRQESSLTKKYVSPLKLKSNEHYEIVGPAITEAIEDINGYIGYGGSGKILNCSERIVDVGEYQVKIDHTLVLTTAVRSNQTLYSHMLSFMLIDDHKDYAPMPTVQPTAKPVHVDISIESTSFGENSIGTPTLYVQFKNDHNCVAVDRIDFAVKCFNVYGQEEKPYGRYDYTEFFYDELINVGKISPSDYYWTLYGVSSVYQVKIAITKYHLKSGETVTVPENQWNWETWTKN